MHDLIDFRCPTEGCGRLLFKVSEVMGIEVEVKCPRCNEIVRASLEAEEQEDKG